MYEKVSPSLITQPYIPLFAKPQLYGNATALLPFMIRYYDRLYSRSKIREEQSSNYSESRRVKVRTRITSIALYDSSAHQISKCANSD